MNLKHPYEKHLAEKLVQLPPPGDPDQNWQQMKSLLDKNMPRGGGKGPGGSYRWWVAGTVVVAVVAGTWFGGKQLLTKEQRNEAVAGTIKTVNNQTAPSVAYTDKNSSQQPVPQTGQNNETAQVGKHDPRGAAYASVTDTQNGNASAGTTTNEQATANNAATDNSAASGNAVTNNQLTAKNNKAAGGEIPSGKTDNPRSSAGLTASNNNAAEPAGNSNTNIKTSDNRKKIYSSGTNNKSGNNNGNYSNRDNSNSANVSSSGNRNSSNVVNSRISRSNHPGAITRNHVNNNTVSKPVKVKGSKGNRGKLNQTEKPLSEITKANNEDINNRYNYTPVITLPSQPSDGSGLKESPVTVKVNYTDGTVVSPSGVIQREFTYYTQADLFPDMVQHNKNTARKSSRSSSTDEDKTFAFGLSLPLAFPLGDQEALGYNSRGGVNTISDYIPSPHFQYHFNNRTYVQAGLQFSSPQFIRPILLYQHEHMGGPNVEVYNMIYARKLYYFNLPVSVYHSPLRNFYMGAGLQFSSMVSGVAQFQQIKRFNSPFGPPEEYIMSNYYTKFKNDSLSNRFNTNEVRLLVDVNYYWNRFTVGLQYNQAFNNYVSFQVNPNMPYVFDKNKSLQFYLRYNIWEDKKRNKLSKNQSVLTLK